MKIVLNKIGSFKASFSILMPSFNQGKYISEAIDSILIQNYNDVELIVLDGGSTDDTLDRLKKFGSKISYIQTGRDGGQASALNQGIKLATGEYIGWLNSDDKYVKGAFEHVEKIFLDYQDVSLVHGNRILIDGEGLVYGWGAQSIFDPDASGFNVCSETSFWRRSCMNDGLNFNDSLRFAMDMDFFCKIYKIGKFYKSDEFFGYFRAHESSKSTTIWDVGLSEAEKVWKSHFGIDHEGWRATEVARPGWRKQMLINGLLNPRISLIPYFYRRLIRQRGLK